MLRRLLSIGLALALALGLICAPVFADNSNDGTVGVSLESGVLRLYHEDGTPKASAAPSNGYTFDPLQPGETYYLPLDESASADTTLLWDVSADPPELSTACARAQELADGELFRLTADHGGDGAKLVKISRVEKSLDGVFGGARGAYLKIVVGEHQDAQELKARVDLTLEAKKDNEPYWGKGDYATLRLVLWIRDPKTPADREVEKGEQAFVFTPQANEESLLEWEDAATLRFDADDTGEDFYVKLSTKADEAVYTRYEIPGNADLFFRCFLGNPVIPSDSRGMLTLRNPWSGKNAPDPMNCRIYSIGPDGELTNVTSLFTYLAADEDGNEVNGWRIKTRTLGNYVICDTELDLGQREAQASSAEAGEKPVARPAAPEKAQAPVRYTDENKPIPLTGTGCLDT